MFGTPIALTVAASFHNLVLRDAVCSEDILLLVESGDVSQRRSRGSLSSLSPGMSTRGRWERGCLSRGFFASWKDR